MNSTLVQSMPLLGAALSGDDVVNTVIWVIVAGICFMLFNWLITYTQCPEPFARVAKVVVAVVVVLMLVNALLGLAGHPLIEWRR